MKLIIAIIPTYKMESVIEALDQIHIYRKTVSTVLGIGKEQREVYRGQSETGNLVKKVQFEIAINDEQVDLVVRAIVKSAQNEEHDGKIFILPMEDCIQIGTGKRGPEAIGQ